MTTKGRWRIGSKVPLNIYDDNGLPVCQCHSEYTARIIVDAMNRREEFAQRETTISQQAETIRALREVLQVLKVRIHFIGWPGESFWDCGEGVMIPDWRNEIAILEDALASSATEEKP